MFSPKTTSLKVNSLMSREDVKSISEVSFMAKPSEKKNGKGFLLVRGYHKGQEKSATCVFSKNT